MIRNILEENDNVQPNDRTMEVLHREFPQCFNAEGKFDMVALQELLQDKVDLVKEGSGFNFLGKNYASLLSSMDTTTVLVPDTEHNEKPENKDSQNVYISGDNLDALKHLVKSYSGKVKCIYIDPPYNTGKDDFAYNDKFKFTAEELEEKLSISEEQAQRIFAMTTNHAASHAAWLTFMMPRLQCAKDLLSDDGVIFISIDDNEQANLKLLCDYVFGEENFMGQVIWKNVTDNNPTQITCEHEYILCYSKYKENITTAWKSKVSAIKDELIKIGTELNQQYTGANLQGAWKKWFSEHKSQLGPLSDYKFIDEGGVYTGSRSVHNPGKNGYYYDVIHPTTGKPCTPPLMGYRFPETSMRKMIEEGRILFGEDENKLVEIKVYASEYQDKFSSVYDSDGRTAANELRALFPEFKQIFKNPKPTELIEHILSFFDLEDSYFVDFFSGSGTTAHALMNLNNDDKQRKFILVQLQEECKSDSEAAKAGYKTIDQIGMERIKRAAKKLKEQNPLFAGDLGFKHYTLQEPDENTIDQMLKFEPTQMFGNNLMEKFGKDTVLFTYGMRDGYGLTPKFEAIKFGSYTAYLCGKHLYMLDSEFNVEEDLTDLVDTYNKDHSFPADNVVIFGYSFNFSQTDAIKKNLGAITDRNRINVDIRY